MTDDLSADDIVIEAEQVLVKLETGQQAELAEAAYDVHRILAESDAPEPQRKNAMWGAGLMPAAGVAGGTENSYWAKLWAYLGLPDPTLIGSYSLKDFALSAVLVIIAVLLLLWWSNRKPRPKQRQREKKALEKLARATGKPKYETTVFKCANDYDTCCASSKNRKICFALAAICITKELLPLVSGGSK
jgi:hypothetical protein